VLTVNDAASPSVGPAGQCRNCDAPLSPGQHFCGHCGQQAGAHRLTLGSIGHEIVHALFHIDHSILALLKGLLLRPGHLARDYIEGRRKRYFGPFGFVVIAAALATFFVAMSGTQWFAPITDSAAKDILTRHFNLVILLQTPILTTLCLLFFWKERLNFAEHLVLVAYTAGLRILYLSFVAVPLMYFTHRTSADPVVFTAYYGPWLAYFTFAAVQFYRGRAWSTAVRAVLAVVVNQLLVMVGIFIFIYTYERMTG
jgi:hypothetical protein